MKRILVTGGTGSLGRHIVQQLHGKASVRVMSRTAQPVSADASIEWAQVDLTRDTGLASALHGVDVVIHAASNARLNTQATDVEGTQRLVEAVRQSAVQHLLYISIVGIERIRYPYYQSKLEAEHVITDSHLPYTILRTTQFHDLVEGLIMTASKSPVMPLPLDFQFQSIAVAEVATELARLALEATPAHMLPDMGGPQVLTLGDMVQTWLAIKNSRRLVLPLPLFGGLADGYRQGYNTCPTRKIGVTTWEQWLRAKYAH